MLQYRCKKPRFGSSQLWKTQHKKWRRQHEEKIIALALAAVMVVLTLGLASCTGGDNTDPAGEGGTNAAKNGTLTVGFDAEFPPMGFKDDNGNYVGFDLDLAKEVAKRLNMDIKLQAIDWNSKDAELKTGIST